MSVRLRDSAVILNPQRVADPNTGRPVVTWDQPPAERPVRFEGQPASSGGSDVDEGTAVEVYTGFLDAADEDHLTTASRVRWQGVDWTVDGPIRKHRRNGRVRFLTFALKRAKKRVTP